MSIRIKPDIKLTKVMLLEAGRRLLNAKEEANKIQQKLDEYNKSNTIFDNDEIIIQTKDIDDHLEFVQMKLGELDLQEVTQKGFKSNG